VYAAQAVYHCVGGGAYAVVGLMLGLMNICCTCFLAFLARQTAHRFDPQIFILVTSHPRFPAGQARIHAVRLRE